MILTTHAIVGGAIASLIPTHPVLAVAGGFASHFAIDAIPHWDYPLHSIALGKEADNRGLKINAALVSDLVIVGVDASVGLVIAVIWFASTASWVTIAIAAIAGMLPDPLQFVHSFYPRGALEPLQRFHSWIHSKRPLRWGLGVSSQIGFVAGVAFLALRIA
jgi:hypothetical protein